jgi:hypothetical protein
VGQGAGDLDQQRPHQLLRDGQGHRQHGSRGRRLQLAGSLCRPGHRDGAGSDRDAARRRCATDRPGILAPPSPRRPNLRNKAPFVGNLTWKALQYTGTSLDDAERELIMSIVGTVIFHAEEAARDPEPIAPTITSISQLLYGQAAGSGTNVTQHLLRCNDYANCDVVTLNTAYTTRPSRRRSRRMMRSIADKIATRTAIPNNSAEVGFVNQTTEPVYKMLSIGATDPRVGPGRQPDRPVPRRDRRGLRLCLPGAQPAAGHGGAGQGLPAAAGQRERAQQMRQRARPCCCSCRRRRTCCTRRSAPSAPWPATWSSWSASCDPACRST